MNHQLERYLNDHHAGSCGAVKLIQTITGRQEKMSDREFFVALEKSVVRDQKLLLELIDLSKMKKSLPLQILGNISESFGRMKLLWEGLDMGKLGQFEALEILVLGIQGKCLLWSVLQEIQPHYPEWNQIDFANLKLEAIRQRNEVEEKRLKAGKFTFTDKLHRGQPIS